MKLLVCTSRSCGRPQAFARFSPILPGTKMRSSAPAARATSICGTSEFLNPSSDMGRRTPVVPMTEMPPLTPSTGFSVFSANPFPAGIAMVTCRPSLVPRTSEAARRMSSRGPGLMDGWPTGTERPGFVTVPMPSPAANVIAPPSAWQTVVNTETPSVMSGSSPENLTTSAQMPPSVCVTALTGIVSSVPSSAVRWTVCQGFPASKSSAALTPAAAQAPVV